MAEDIKGLIEKIQREGVQAAEAKAKEIEEAAKEKAASMTEEAKQGAREIIVQAREEAKRIKEATDANLAQAARDMLISLESEINAMLKRLIESKVRQTLTADDLAKIILSSIKEYAAKSKEEIIISLSKADSEKLDGLIGELKEHIKQKIIVKAADDIQAGFAISFDAGRSRFDFSAEALAGYIGAYLKPKLNAILKQAISNI